MTPKGPMTATEALADTTRPFEVMNKKWELFTLKGTTACHQCYALIPMASKVLRQRAIFACVECAERSGILWIGDHVS